MKLQTPNYKLIGSAFILILLGLAVSTLLYGITLVLSNYLKLFPMSDMASVIINIIGILASCQLYGNMIEKKHPGLLTENYIKKLALTFVILKIILAVSIFIVLIIFAPNKLLLEKMDLSAIGISLFALIFIFVATYFIAKQMLSLGVKARQKQIK